MCGGGGGGGLSKTHTIIVMYVPIELMYHTEMYSISAAANP